MPKVDLMLAIIQAGISIQEDPRVNHLYALLGQNRNQLEALLEGIPSDADVFAHDAVLWTLGIAGKPNWIAAIGL